MQATFTAAHRSKLTLAVTFLATSWFMDGASGEEAQWIWSPEHDQDSIPHVACHFRKSFNLQRPVRGQVTIRADDTYDLYVNGRRVTSNRSGERLAEHNITRYLTRGRNIVAIKAVNSRGSTAGVAARVMIKEADSDWESFSTDSSWRTSLRPLPFWNTVLYNDGRWAAAAELGKLGETAPWDVRESIAESEEDAATERFQVADEFVVEQLLGGDDTGSLIAMTFNEFGHILASREGGQLLLIFDADNDGQVDTVRDYCNEVKNCQGILALNGEVFVTAEGPEGAGLYRLSDSDRNGTLEKIRLLVKFKGGMGEHGAHGINLGSDGMLYVVVGNHGALEETAEESSPYRDSYEGDLHFPRNEDPSGHARGLKAPGGVVIRTDIDGKKVEVVAGGLRNPYDLAFNRQGDLFVHDSDMESDMGTTWYRPTRLYHLTPGSEFGWRSGWAKWPEYFVDTVPAVLETGRGSPTGAVFYNHFAFPTRYHGKLFLADWSQGRILAVKVKRDGATFSGSSEVFLEGRPLNVTDLAIGKEGALYFVTGGRGTEGGIYRIAWQGQVPESVADLGTGMSAAIRQPQLQSAWSRQKIAGIRQSLGANWSKQIRGVVRSSANPWYYRVRAMDLMQLFGPTPSADLLIKLSKDENEIVRGKAVQLMGLHVTEATNERLLEMLADSDRVVRRRACEALLRSGGDVGIGDLRRILVSDDRVEAWAARRLLERQPVDDWSDLVLGTEDHRVFIQGSLALAIADPSPDNMLAVIQRFREFSSEFISDRDFVDMLRLVQIGLERSGLAGGDVPQLCELLAEEFPSSDATMNRELVRLLVYLQVSDNIDSYFEYLFSDIDQADKLHTAMHMRYLESGWTTDDKLALLEFFEEAKKEESVGGSYREYVANAERDFAKSLNENEALEVLARGDTWPTAALGVLYSLPNELPESLVDELMRLDDKLSNNETDTAVAKLKVGVLAVLARSGDELSQDYLRYVWETTPERRQTAAMGLSQRPSDQNMRYLLKSLPILEDNIAKEVLVQLLENASTPDDPEAFRQVILLGLKLKEKGAEDAIRLLNHWTAEHPVDNAKPWKDQLRGWQRWYAKSFPDRPPAQLPIESAESKWKFDDLYAHLASQEGAKGSAVKGAHVFSKAQCIKCHRVGERGEQLGPDLTSLSKRFTKKEVLQSIVFPSHVISDQYASKTIVSDNGKIYTGMVSVDADGDHVVIQKDGNKVTVTEDDIAEIKPSKKSSMPNNLLDELTLSEISDLFAYLGIVRSQSVALTVDDE